MVKLDDQRVALYLSDEGRRVLRQAGLGVPDAGGTTFDVLEASELGLWIRIDYEDKQQHWILIRWDYILAVDVTVGEIRTEGLVH